MGGMKVVFFYNMAKVLSDARTLVRSFLDEATAADWSNAELNTLINVKYHEVRAMVVTVYEDYYMTTANFNSVASQQEYTSTDSAPTNIFKIRRVELNYDVAAAAGAPTRCLPLHNFDAVRRDLAYTNSGIGLKTYGNAFYYSYGFRSNFTIGFIPEPDKAGTNAVKIWYIREAADLSGDSSDIDIPYADKNYIYVVYGAAADALRFGQQATSEANNFESLYKAGMTKMQEELEDRVAEEGKSVIDTQGVSLDFLGGGY